MATESKPGSFKFTFDGEIEVSLRVVGKAVRLTMDDGRCSTSEESYLDPPRGYTDVSSHPRTE